MPHGFHTILKFAVCSCFLAPVLLGCAAFHPMDGVPVRYLPEDMKVGDRSGKRTIKLSLLGQPWDGIYRVDTGDILAIYVGGILGKKDENPQVYIPQNSESSASPSAGTPVTVREDGTISLPMIKPLIVRGKTTSETEEMIRQAYTNHEVGRELLPPGEERILVSLLKPRQTRVMVVRQDSRSEPMSNQAIGLLNIGTTKRGTGKMVSLPAYHNDVLNALVATDGLPGLDAENAVYIIRRQLGPDGKPTPASSAIDPEQLIRKSQDAAAKPVVRGQNYDLWYGSSGNSNGSESYYPASQTGNGLAGPGHGQQIPPQNVMNLPTGAHSLQSQDPQRATLETANSWGRPNFDSNAPGVQSSRPASNESLRNQKSAHHWDSVPAPGWSGGFPELNVGPSSQGSPLPAQPTISNPAAMTSPTTERYPAIQTSNPAGRPNSQQVSYQGTAPVVTPYEAPSPSGPGYSLPAPLIPTQETPYFEGDSTLSDDAHSDYDTDQYGIADADDGRKIIRIPIRLGPGEHVNINPEDVILYEGDIVFIESRDSEVFFTGGLLGGGQYTLPRDFDLDILKALSIATSRTTSSGAARQLGGVSALNSDVTISPSNVVVIRTLPEGGEVAIKIDIYRARNDLSERLIIQPGDYIYLQYTPAEAVAAFIERHLLEGALFGLFTQQLGNQN